MSKHTPGPWHIAGGEGRGLWVDCEDPNGDGYSVCRLTGAWGNLDSQRDARLIAAAPDLLVAVEAIDGDSRMLDEEVWDMIQAAIRKAHGES